MMIAGFYLQELPSSNTLQNVLPEWPLILTMYFTLSNRFFFGVISAFFIGLIQDVFLGVPTLGLHAGIYTLMSFTLIVSRLYFIHLNLTAQSLFIGALVFTKICIVMIYNSIFFSTPNHFWIFLSIPFSMLLWPGIFVFFQFFAKRHSA